MLIQQIPAAFPWGSFAVLYAVGLLGGIAILPFLAALIRARTGETSIIRRQLGLQYLQNAIVLACSISLGLKAAVATGLARSVTEGWAHGIAGGGRRLMGCALAGMLSAFIVCLIDYLILLPRLSTLRESLRPITGLPVRDKLLAALYGGIAEELIMRLGLFSLLAWATQSLVHGGTPSLVGLWSVNIAVSLLFAAGHLPAMAALAPLTTHSTARVLILNFPLSLLFGYYYFTLGLEAAMLTHVAASVTLQLASEF